MMTISCGRPISPRPRSNRARLNSTKRTTFKIRLTNDGKTHRVEFEVEATGIADGFPLGVAAPQCRRRRAAVGADQTGPPVPSTPAATTTATRL